VLVFLIWGFGTGWSNLWSKITAFTGGESNVDTIQQACQLACDGQQIETFCYDVKTLKISKDEQYSGSCQALINNGKGGISACSFSCDDTRVKATYKQIKPAVQKTFQEQCTNANGDWVSVSANCPQAKSKIHANIKDATNKCCVA
jgi:hypothetical protein